MINLFDIDITFQSINYIYRAFYVVHTPYNFFVLRAFKLLYCHTTFNLYHNKWKALN